MNSNYLLLVVFVIAHILFFVHAWKNAVDYQSLNDSERESELLDFYRP